MDKDGYKLYIGNLEFRVGVCALFSRMLMVDG